MKKYLFILSVAALGFAACSNDDVVAENTTLTQQPKEISFFPLNQKATRAAVDGTTFPTTSTIEVAAYDVTHTRDFFGATTFSYDTGTIWKGGKYWPLSAAYINFLAYANFEGTSATWGSTHKASGVTLVMTDNKTAQQDLMYAIGNGEVTQSGNTLTFPENVPMVFKHAQAWISFKADAYDATSGGKVTLNKITLNGAKYNGTYTITHTNYDASSGQSVAGSWSVLGSTADVEVPGWSAANIAYDASGDGVDVGYGLMIVPDDATTGDFTSFTINYTLDGLSYEYTYTPAATDVEQGKHYIYNINFHLHEILISASVTDWADQTSVDVPIF